MLWFDDKKQWPVIRTSTPLSYAVMYCLPRATCKLQNKEHHKSTNLILNICSRICVYELWFVVGFEYTNKLRVKCCFRFKNRKIFRQCETFQFMTDKMNIR